MINIYNSMSVLSRDSLEPTSICTLPRDANHSANQPSPMQCNCAADDVLKLFYVLDIFIHHRGGRNKQKKTVITITTIWKKEVTSLT